MLPQVPRVLYVARDARKRKTKKKGRGGGGGGGGGGLFWGERVTELSSRFGLGRRGKG